MVRSSSAIGFREAIRREALRRELRELARRYDISDRLMKELQDDQQVARHELEEVRERSAPEEQRSAVRLAELQRLREGLGYAPDEADPAAVLYQASVVSAVGSQVPDFSYYGPVKRWLARGVARVVLFCAGIITSHQRIFNDRLLRVVSAVAARNEDLSASLGRLQVEALEAKLRGVDAGLQVLQASVELRQMGQTVDQTLDGLADTVDGRLSASAERLEALAAEVAGFESRVAGDCRGDSEPERLSSALAATEERVRRLERVCDVLSRDDRRRPRTDGEGEVLAGRVSLDRLYADFEERFRGTREDISHRITEYLPAVRETAAITEDRPLVDLGSGRGEWLERLQEIGVAAYGVDRNQVFVESSRSLGLHVVEADVLEHLQVQSDGALGAVTAFHLIEHLTPTRMIELLVECRRVLAPGGLLLLETPNPENLTVGAATFYSDPSHVRPVYPATLAFLLQRLGFDEVGLHSPTVGREPTPEIPQIGEDEPLAETINPAARAINEHLRSPLDFAVFARVAP